MTEIRFLTAGESHGPQLTVIVEGLPSGLSIDKDRLAHELKRRRTGAGSGGRMKLEADELSITAGVRHGYSLGSPISVSIRNSEFDDKWSDEMSPEPTAKGFKPLQRPRPGHADLAGMIKYGHRDARNVLERASARETAARVVAGTLARIALDEIGVQIVGHTLSIGTVVAPAATPTPGDSNEIEVSETRSVDPKTTEQMLAEIASAKSRGDTLGGVFEILAYDVPQGLGSHVHWDRKIDARLASALMSIQGMKAVALGDGFTVHQSLGSEAHDEISYETSRGLMRTTNRAGGVEGGITNGETLRVSVAMKPISTLRKPLESVDIETKESSTAIFERSDVCAVPRAVVIGEAVVAWVIAQAAFEKFGGDTIQEFCEAKARHATCVAQF